MTKALYFIIPVLLLFLFLIFRTNKLNSRKESTYDYQADNLDSDNIAQVFSKSIQFATISQKDCFATYERHFQNFLNYLEETFPLVHKKLKKEIVNGYSLVYTWEGKRNSKSVLLMGHYDVVPVESNTENEWIFKPFAGTISEGYIWGRGTVDDKAGVISTLYALEHLLKKGYETDKTIYFAFGHDEEVGGNEGALQISKMFKEKGIFVDYVFDEGGAIIDSAYQLVKKPLAMVGIAEKGYLSLELTAESSGGHSSLPGKKTSIGELSRAIVNLEKEQCPIVKSQITIMFLERLVPYVSFPVKIVLANLWLFWSLLTNLVTSPLFQAMIRTTTAVTKMEAGVKDNILPTRAKAIVNFRIIPGNSSDYILEHVKKVVNNPEIKIGKYGANWEPSKISGLENSGYLILNKTINQIFPGVPVIPNLVLGATDSRHFSSVCDNIYRFRPLKISSDEIKRVHGINERIAITDLVKMVQFYILLIENINKQL